MKFLQSTNNRLILLFFIVFIVVLVSLYPLAHRGFFVSDDGEWMAIRLSAFYEALRNGQFPTRFLMRLNQGYGYPVADFLYPGFLYLGVFFHLFGFSFVGVIKLLMAISMVGSGIFAFLWLRKLFDSNAALIAAIFYVLSPYHLYDLYVRGNVGELLALCIAPFILWQIERRKFVWISIGVGLLLLFHNTLALFFLGVVILYALYQSLVSEDRAADVKRNAFAILLGLGLAAFFWIPAIYDLQYTVFSSIQISDWRQYFADIWLVGIETYLIFLGVLILLIKGRYQRRVVMFPALMMFMGLLSLFLASSGSTVFWQILPVSFVQFPFRFLSVTLLCAAFLLAFLLTIFPKKTRWYAIGVLILFLSVSTWGYLTNIKYTDKGEGFYATNLATTTVKNEYMPRGVTETPSSLANQRVTTVHGTIGSLIATPSSISFNVTSRDATIISIMTVYFPGWYATLDNNDVSILTQSPNGIMQIAVPSGTHHIRAFFRETPLRILADIISLCSLLFLLIYWLLRRKKMHEKN